MMEYVIDGMLYALDAILTGFGITVIVVGLVSMIYYPVKWAILAGHRGKEDARER